MSKLDSAIKSRQEHLSERPETRRFPLLQPDEREKLERGFSEAEASTFLSDLSLSENYFAIKARILAGEIAFDRGQEEILAYHRVKNSSLDKT